MNIVIQARRSLNLNGGFLGWLTHVLVLVNGLLGMIFEHLQKDKNTLYTPWVGSHNLDSRIDTSCSWIRFIWVKDQTYTEYHI
jgi:hypothetical protein